MFVECPTGSHLAYNNSQSFCFELMPAADCADMLDNCQTKYGPYTTLMRIHNADVFDDVTDALR